MTEKIDILDEVALKNELGIENYDESPSPNTTIKTALSQELLLKALDGEDISKDVAEGVLNVAKARNIDLEAGNCDVHYEGREDLNPPDVRVVLDVYIPNLAE